jgi:ectoine hydroxylase-related dioxygenase (phytanoyl-CoA dioxygenase family)
MNPTTDLAAHAAAVIECGYTIIPAQVSPDQIAALNAAADRALDKVTRVTASGVRVAHTQVNRYVRAARCFYTWDTASRRLLGHATVQALGKLVLGQPRLWEMTVLEALPKPDGADLGPFDWHRDFSAAPADGLQQSYLWVFTCLTDVTSDNGATWVVPGSHRDPSLRPPGQGDGQAGGNAVQLTARAGDIVVINPVMLHRVGDNRTRSGRRLALVGFCRSDRPPLLNHWLIGGQRLRRELPASVSAQLYTKDWSLDTNWEVLPDDWTVESPPPLQRAMRGLARAGGIVLRAPGRVWHHLGRSPPR